MQLILAHDAPARLPAAEPDGDSIDLLALGQDAIVVAPRRRGLAMCLSDACDLGGVDPPVWLRMDIDEDDRIRVDGPAAAAIDLAGLTERTSGLDGWRTTPFRVERVGGRIVAVAAELDGGG